MNIFFRRKALWEMLQQKILFVQQIATCIGNDQAIAFANMIRTVEPLSTVNLLHTLYQLEEADWDCCFRYSTAKKRREFLSHFGKEEDPREKKGFALKDDDFER